MPFMSSPPELGDRPGERYSKLCRKAMARLGIWLNQAVYRRTLFETLSYSEKIV
jgi:hypothetical protein